MTQEREYWVTDYIKYFENIVAPQICDDVKNAKPDPEIFRIARTCFGILPEFCFVIEDSESGIRSAQADGMKVIGVVAQHTQKELKLFGTVATISRLDELLKLSLFQSNI